MVIRNSASTSCPVHSIQFCFDIKIEVGWTNFLHVYGLLELPKCTFPEVLVDEFMKISMEGFVFSVSSKN